MEHYWIIKDVDESSMKDLIGLFNEEKKGIEIFLSYYFRGESATVENLDFKSPPSYDSSTAGTIRIDFDVAYFNLCWNIDGQSKDSMTVNFDWEPELKRLKLQGPDLS